MITLLFCDFPFLKKWRGGVREEKTEKYGFIYQHQNSWTGEQEVIQFISDINFSLEYKFH